MTLMDNEAEVKQEQIRALREYIRLLEKVSQSLFGYGLNSTERRLMDAIDRRVSFFQQAVAVGIGIGIFIISLVIGRLVGRNPLFLLLPVAAGLISAIMTVVTIYRHARRQIIEKEISKSQLDIYRLEGQLNK